MFRDYRPRAGIVVAARLRYVVDWRTDGGGGGRRRGGARPGRAHTECDEGPGGERGPTARGRMICPGNYMGISSC